MNFWSKDPLANIAQNEGVGSRHHLLARSYMERFADARGRITAITRDTGERRTQSVKRTLVERDFYTVINTDMQADGRVEKLLGFIEGSAVTTIRNTCSDRWSIWPPSPDYREALIMFTAFQVLRGRRQRRSIEIIADLYERSYWSHLSEDNAVDVLRSHGTEPTEQAVSELLAWRRSLDDIDFVPSTNDHIALMLDLFPRYSHALRRRPMRIHEWQHDCLITADEPVVLMPSPDHLDGPVGLANAFHVWLPLGPRHLLVFGPDGELGPDTWVPSAHLDPGGINAALVHNSYEVYLTRPGSTPPGVDGHPGARPVMNIWGGDGFIDHARYAHKAQRVRPMGGFRMPEG